MKKYLPLLLAALSLPAWAQKSAVFYQSQGPAYQIPALSIDSVKFSDGNSRALFWLNGARTASYAVSSLDSICFVADSKADGFVAAASVMKSVDEAVIPSTADIASVSVDEVIPTVKTDPEYDDFLENYTKNASSLTTVTIDYSDNNVNISYSPSKPKGLDINCSGCHVVAKTNSVDGKLRYRLQGSTSNGSFKIADMGEDNKKLILELYGVSITNPMGAAINIQSGKAVYVKLQQGKDNYLKDGAVYVKTSGEDMKGAFFSEGQLLFSGAGTLSVTALGGHGICSDDYIRIRQNTGTITIKSAKDGFSTKDRFIMYGGNVVINSADEGISVNKGDFRQYGGKLTVQTNSSKAHAVSAVGNIEVHGGLVDSHTGGAASKCLTSDSLVTVSGGFVRLVADGNPEFDAEKDDYSTSACIKSAGGVTVSGGTLVLKNNGVAGKCINTDAWFSVSDASVAAWCTGADFSQDAYSARSRVVDAVNVTVGGSASVQLAGAKAAIHSTGTIYINGGQAFAYTLEEGGKALTGKPVLSQSGGLLLWGE